jgi:hypothetical protein
MYRLTPARISRPNVRDVSTRRATCFVVRGGLALVAAATAVRGFRDVLLSRGIIRSLV